MKEAHEKGSLFVVHNLAMKYYAEHLMPEFPRNRIITLNDNIGEQLRGTTDPVIDHAVWEVGNPRYVEQLRKVLPFVTRP